MTTFSYFPLLPLTKNPALAWNDYKTGDRHASPTQVDQWRAAGNNLAVATGAVSNCIVLDCDSAEATTRARQNGMPDTYSVTTPRGSHFYFAHPGGHVGNRAKLGGNTGWDIRGDGGYVVAAGSYFVPTDDEVAKGKVEGAYLVERDVPPARPPQWLLDLIVKTAPPVPVVAYSAGERTTPYGRSALAQESSELAGAIRGENLSDTIYRVSARLAELTAGGEIVFDEAREALTDGLRQHALDEYDPGWATLERGWTKGWSNPKCAPERIARTADALFGARDDVPPPPVTNGRTITVADDKTDHLTIEKYIGIVCAKPIRYDEFAAVIRIGDNVLTDHLERELWLWCREQSTLKFAWDLFGHVLRNVAWTARYHPLRDYLDGVQPTWDGTTRIDDWMTRYLDVETSPYSQSVGALFLTALVRRVRQPGAKFDEMLVLEGPQGIDKSSALAALCPDEAWFTDEVSVGMQSKELLEITNGKWIVEAPELKGLVGRGVDHVKAFLSRRYDKARMAFDRNTTERGREWIAAATTNDSQYLDDPSGNRRIWPVVVRAVDMGGLRADRDQLWAEAAQREASGASIRMPRHLWATAAEHQAERVLYDSLRDDLLNLLDGKTGRVRGRDVLQALGVPAERRGSLNRKFGETMRSLGWDNKMVKVDGEGVRYFVKGNSARSIIYGPSGFTYEEPNVKAV